MDPRIDQGKNDEFLDQMERYFTLRSKQFAAKMEIKDMYDGNGLPLGLQYGYQ